MFLTALDAILFTAERVVEAQTPLHIAARQVGGVAITARGLDKSFGPKAVLSGLDLHVPAGQFLAIVGRSGCGKSTLLRLIVGLDMPTGGAIAFGNEAGSQTASRIMFQEPRLLPWARVLANVEVGLGSGADAGQRRVQALAALEGRILDHLFKDDAPSPRTVRAA